jgi:transcriptional regulator with XRE-family HTH domain
MLSGMAQTGSSRPTDTSKELEGFAARLDEICTDMGITEARGRQAELGRQFGVTPKAARRWLVGEGYPETKVIAAIARWAEVNIEWLMTGRGPKRGNLIDTKAFVLDEALRSLGPEARKEALDFIRYKLERARSNIISEKLGRYMVALDRYDDETPSKRK